MIESLESSETSGVCLGLTLSCSIRDGVDSGVTPLDLKNELGVLEIFGIEVCHEDDGVEDPEV